MDIVFFGTPDFAVKSLSILVENGFNIKAVVTSADKPAGRGRKIKFSEVKDYCLANGLKVLQPLNLKEEAFVKELNLLKADLFIVVAFRMLPEVVWAMPDKGTFNLHASLLPQYRGAAPINHAIINGESKTGVTSFFLQHKIDTGNIIFRNEIEIGENENASSLHDRLKVLGADLVLKTVKAIESNNIVIKEQSLFLDSDEVLNAAPKLNKEFCRLDWNQDKQSITNKVRGLSSVPAAWSSLVIKDGSEIIVKILEVKIDSQDNDINRDIKVGGICTDNKSFLKVRCSDGYVDIIDLQISGKKRLKVREFLNGNKIEKTDYFV